MRDASLLEMFREGGPTMYFIVLLFAAALPVAVVALIMGKRGPVFGVVALVAAIMLTGVGGMMLGRVRTDAALGNVPADLRDAIRSQGYLESSRNIQFAGLASLPLALLAVAAWQRASRR
jgi:hypothetical protein